MIVRLPAGELKLKARYGDNTRLRRIVFSRLNDNSEAAQRFKRFEQRSPLSYFLWNAPPDQRLLDLAAKDGRSRTRESSDGSLTTSATGTVSALHQLLDGEIERMIRDPRFGQFVHEFASQWLSLDKFDVVACGRNRPARRPVPPFSTAPKSKT